MKYKLNFLLSVSLFAFTTQATELSIEQAVQQAIKNDLWFSSNRDYQRAIIANAEAVGALPDPKLSMTLANLPIESLSLSDEGMSQIKVSVSQQLARGDSLKLKTDKLKTKAKVLKVNAKLRSLHIRKLVSQLWLDVFYAQQAIALIEADYSLFEQVVDIANASYTSALGNTRQHDVISAQLELIQLQDKLEEKKRVLAKSKAALSQWLIKNHEDMSFAPFNSSDVQVSAVLPEISINHLSQLKKHDFSMSFVLPMLAQHPTIKSLSIEHDVARYDIEIAKQAYQPQWGVNASYGYRGDNQLGQHRSDLLSVGLSVDLPLFTDNKQDKALQSATLSASAKNTEKLAAIKSMYANLSAEFAHLKGLASRQDLYQKQLLSQSNQQAEATLAAYTNDDGDFSEVVRAKIARLNVQLAALKIDVDLLKSITEINYLLIVPNDHLNEVKQ